MVAFVKESLPYGSLAMIVILKQDTKIQQLWRSS